jgi:hypothetical protein
LSLLIIPGGFYLLPLRGDEKVRVGPQVNAHRLARRGKGFGLHLADKYQVPCIPFPLDRGGLELPL